MLFVLNAVASQVGREKKCKKGRTINKRNKEMVKKKGFKGLGKQTKQRAFIIHWLSVCRLQWGELYYRSFFPIVCTSSVVRWQTQKTEVAENV